VLIRAQESRNRRHTEAVVASAYVDCALVTDVQYGSTPLYCELMTSVMTEHFFGKVVFVKIAAVTAVPPDACTRTKGITT
jgi:hypothetical protein